jgi:hypothetical protein
MVAVIRVRARGEWLVLPGRSADATRTSGFRSNQGNGVERSRSVESI